MGNSFGTACSKDAIASALAVHSAYTEELDNYNTWMRLDNNAGKLVLYNVIKDLIRNKSSGGVWENENKIPSLSDIDSWKDADRWNNFEAELKSKREPIEEMSNELVTIFKSQDFIEQYNRLPWDEQIILNDIFATGLDESAIGKAYLNDCLDKTFSDGSIFNPENIIENSTTFWNSTLPVFRRTERAYASMAIKLLPAIAARGNDSVNIYIFRITMKLLNVPGYGTTNPVVVTLTDLRVFLKKVRETLQNHPNVQTLLGGFGGFVQLFVELVQLYVTLKDIQANPGSRNYFKTIQVLSNTAIAFETFRQSINWKIYAADYSALDASGKFGRVAVRLSTRQLNFLSVIVGIHDVVTASIDGYSAWKHRDYGVVAGNVLVGVGSAGSVAVSLIVAANAAAAAGEASAPLISLGVVPGILLGLACTAVVFLGTFLCVTMKKSDLEKWLQCNYFGSEWEDYETDDDPESPSFRFKFLNEPHFNRQVSQYYSIFNPLGAKMVCREDNSGNGTFVLEVEIQPKLASHSSGIVIREIDINGMHKIHPALHVSHLNVEGECIPFSPSGTDSLLEWKWNCRDLTEDYTGKWFELTITIPDKEADAMWDLIKAFPDAVDDLANVIRQRVKVESAT